MRNYTDEQKSNFTLKELESFSDNQLEVLSIEDLRSDLGCKNLQKKDERIEEFWKGEYPKLPVEERARHWAGGLFQSMRMQEESRQNPYAIYSENWLRDALKTEPDFIELLPEIYNIWGGMFDAGKVDRILQRLLKRINESN